MKKIYLSGMNEKNVFFIVDDEDFDKLKNQKFYQWKNTYCVHIFKKRKRIPVSRLILGESEQTIVEYKNGDRLDLRKSNLEIRHRLVLEEKGGLLYIKFNDGRIAVTNICFKYLFDKYNWYLTKRGYIRKSDDSITFHETILNPSKGKDCDHINGDTLDNRIENLREVSKSQNMMNRKKVIKKSSIYKGVSKSRTGYWVSRICINKVSFYLGEFKKEEDAALAYNQKAIELFGEYAKLNVVPNQQ